MSEGALRAAIDELERSARELRGDGIEPERAAELVDRCAELAAEIGRELDRAARDAPEGQERLL